MLSLAAVHVNASLETSYLFSDTQLMVTWQIAILILTNCYGITNLFFTEINFHWKSDLFTKILYYENLELYGITVFRFYSSVMYINSTLCNIIQSVWGIPYMNPNRKRENCIARVLLM